MVHLSGIGVTRFLHCLKSSVVFGFICSCSFSAFSVSLYTETFFDSTGGWQDRDAGKMTVTNILIGGNPGGALRGQFQLQGGPPFPDNDAFIATGRLSSASFIGDYTEVDAWVLGFDFMASNVVPSFLQVQLYSESNVITRLLTSAITTNNVWYSFRLSLLAADLGGWAGDTALFSSIMTNVTKVEFNLTRNAEGTQSYFLDNIFLDRVPDAVDITATNMIWLHMRSGQNYRFEASTDLTSTAWTTLSSFTATSSVYEVSVPPTNSWQFYRMVIP